MTGSFSFPRVQAIPQVGRASLCLDGVERVGYDFGLGGSRPFLLPLIGPSGAHLTRLGHPNPIGHEHHKSIWFGHQKVAGINFWEKRPHTDIRIRHRCVRLYHDGPNWGGLVADLDWWAEGRSILRQELTIVLEPCALQRIRPRYPVAVRVLRPGAGRARADPLRIPGNPGRQDHVRTVWRRHAHRRPWFARKIGDLRQGQPLGRLLGSDRTGKDRRDLCHGPSVQPQSSDPLAFRGDGWIGPSFNPDSPHGLARDHPLALRYRLLVHSGQADADGLNRAWETYARTAAYEIVPPHQRELACLRRGEVSA